MGMGGFSLAGMTYRTDLIQNRQIRIGGLGIVECSRRRGSPPSHKGLAARARARLEIVRGINDNRGLECSGRH
jgi:hypothetical protein